jgi:hypothetical protein
MPNRDLIDMGQRQECGQVRDIEVVPSIHAELIAGSTLGRSAIAFEANV